jgi:hypothetical protein
MISSASQSGSVKSTVESPWLIDNARRNGASAGDPMVRRISGGHEQAR